MVEYIKYQNKEYPVRISYSAIKRIQDTTDKNISDLLAEGDISLYEKLLYYGMRSGAKADKQEFTFEMGDMEDILDECFLDFVKLVPKFFPDNELDPQSSLNKDPVAKTDFQKNVGKLRKAKK